MTETTPGDEKSLSGISQAFYELAALSEIVDLAVGHSDNKNAINAIQNPSLRGLVTKVYNAAHETLTSRIMQGQGAEDALIGFAATIRDLSDTYKIDFSPEQNIATTPPNQESEDESISKDELKKLVGYNQIIEALRNGVKDKNLLDLAESATDNEINVLATKMKKGMNRETALKDFNTAMGKLSDVVSVDLPVPPKKDGPSFTIAGIEF